MQKHHVWVIILFLSVYLIGAKAMAQTEDTGRRFGYGVILEIGAGNYAPPNTDLYDGLVIPYYSRLGAGFFGSVRLGKSADGKLTETLRASIMGGGSQGWAAIDQNNNEIASASGWVGLPVEYVYHRKYNADIGIVLAFGINNMLIVNERVRGPLPQGVTIPSTRFGLGTLAKIGIRLGSNFEIGLSQSTLFTRQLLGNMFGIYVASGRQAH